MAPPRAGPAARARLNDTELSATAAGNSRRGTCSRTEDCQAGPYSAAPVPSRKVRRMRSHGVICPSQARTARAAETASIAHWATNMISRLSQTSAAAPAGRENSTIGRTVDTWTRATMSAEGASEVISHVAPTPWTRLPKFDRRLAIHIARKMRDRNGARADGAAEAAYADCEDCNPSLPGCAIVASDTIHPSFPERRNPMR